MAWVDVVGVKVGVQVGESDKTVLECTASLLVLPSTEPGETPLPETDFFKSIDGLTEGPADSAHVKLKSTLARN